MSISDFTDCEEVEHLLVLEKFGLFELVNCQLPVVDGDEVDQLAVVFHIDVHLLDCGLIVQNIFFDGRFTLEERLHRCFT